eukprot:Ihof_evm1s792 gene=Ihof_evmTU1s792
MPEPQGPQPQPAHEETEKKSEVEPITDSNLCDNSSLDTTLSTNNISDSILPNTDSVPVSACMVSQKEDEQVKEENEVVVVTEPIIEDKQETEVRDEAAHVTVKVESELVEDSKPPGPGEGTQVTVEIATKGDSTESDKPVVNSKDVIDKHNEVVEKETPVTCKDGLDPALLDTKEESANGDHGHLHNESGECDYSDPGESEAEEEPLNDLPLHPTPSLLGKEGNSENSVRPSLDAPVTLPASSMTSDSEQCYVAVLPSETLNLKLRNTVRLDIDIGRAGEFSLIEMVEGPKGGGFKENDDLESGPDSPKPYGGGAGKWLNEVIAKYENAVENPSKKRGRPIDDDDYDVDDPWIDDSELMDEVDAVGTKYGGFYICSGTVEDLSESELDDDGDEEDNVEGGSEADDTPVEVTCQATSGINDGESPLGLPSDREKRKSDSLQPLPPAKKPHVVNGANESVDTSTQPIEITAAPPSQAPAEDSTATVAAVPPTSVEGGEGKPAQRPVVGPSKPSVATGPSPISEKRKPGRPRLQMPGAKSSSTTKQAHHLSKNKTEGSVHHSKPSTAGGIKRCAPSKEEEVFLRVLAQPLTDILRWLRQRDINKPLNEDGRTALHILAMEEKERVEIAEETIDLLTRHGADIALQDKGGCTALHLAIMHNPIQLPLVRKLLQLNANINAQDHNGDSVLHIATRRGKVKTVKLLLDKGASTWLENKKGLTAFDEAQDGVVDNAREMSRMIRDCELKFMRGLGQGGSQPAAKENVAGTGTQPPSDPVPITASQPPANQTKGATGEAPVAPPSEAVEKIEPSPSPAYPLSFEVPPEIKDLLDQLASHCSATGDGDIDKRGRLVDEDVRLLADLDNRMRSCHMKNRSKQEMYNYLESLTRVKKNTMKLRINMYHLDSEKERLLGILHVTLGEAASSQAKAAAAGTVSETEPILWTPDVTQKLMDVTTTKCRSIMRRFGRNQEVISKFVELFLRQEVMPLWPGPPVSLEELMTITRPAYILVEREIAGKDDGDDDDMAGGDDVSSKMATPESKGHVSDDEKPGGPIASPLSSPKPQPSLETAPSEDVKEVKPVPVPSQPHKSPADVTPVSTSPIRTSPYFSIPSSNLGPPLRPTPTHDLAPITSKISVAPPPCPPPFSETLEPPSTNHPHPVRATPTHDPVPITSHSRPHLLTETLPTPSTNNSPPVWPTPTHDPPPIPIAPQIAASPHPRSLPHSKASPPPAPPSLPSPLPSYAAVPQPKPAKRARFSSEGITAAERSARERDQMEKSNGEEEKKWEKPREPMRKKEREIAHHHRDGPLRPAQIWDPPPPPAWTPEHGLHPKDMVQSSSLSNIQGFRSMGWTGNMPMYPHHPMSAMAQGQPVTGTVAGADQSYYKGPSNHVMMDRGPHPSSAPSPVRPYGAVREGDQSQPG